MGPVQSYNVAQAKAHLSEILKRISEGEEILLTRRGKPIARIVPAVQTAASVLGAGADDPNINFDVIARDDWWKPLPDNETQTWYD